MSVYRIADRPTVSECVALDVRRPRIPQGTHPIRAISTGEFRCPKKGEWYLSGAVVEAYRASWDLGSAYHIATLVVVENCERVVRVLEKTRVAKTGK